MLLDLSCQKNQVAKWNGTKWLCAADQDRVHSNTDTLAELKKSASLCADRSLIKINSEKKWLCSEDSGSKIETTRSCPQGKDSCIIQNYGHWQWRQKNIAHYNTLLLP